MPHIGNNQFFLSQIKKLTGLLDRSGSLIPCFTEGVICAIKAWIDNANFQREEFEISRLPLLQETVDYLGTLRKAGIKSFILTAHSPDIIDFIILAKDCGYIYKEPADVVSGTAENGEKIHTDGLRFVDVA